MLHNRFTQNGLTCIEKLIVFLRDLIKSPRIKTRRYEICAYATTRNKFRTDRLMIYENFTEQINFKSLQLEQRTNTKLQNILVHLMLYVFVGSISQK